MRIKLNSAKNLEQFPAAKLAKMWVLKGHKRSDAPFSKKRKRKEDEWEDMEMDEMNETDAS